MSKLKKLFAVLLSFAMVMGVSMTTFAEEVSATYKSDITVSGLAAGEEKTVNLYSAIVLNDAKNAWVIAEWAKPYISLDTTKNTYVITDAEGLAAHVSGTPVSQILNATQTSVVFENMPVGAYVVTSSGVKASYAPMVAETYVEDAKYMQAEDIEVTAKTSGYQLTKEQKVEESGNRFVRRGETVTFTITTTFPSFKVANSPDNSYKIVDTPTGLDIVNVSSVTIGGDTVTLAESDKAEVMNQDGTTRSYTIDLSGSIGTTNANAGKTVVVEYTAVVMADDGYTNTANAFRGRENLGEDTEKGYSGDITITKYDAEDETTILSGAEFKVYKNGGETPLCFIRTGTGTYKLALAGEAGANDTIAATNGTVKITGLDEGTYFFKETKAPEGYSINEKGVSVTIVKNERKNVSMTGSLTDTKLSSLPSTGGIGTTIFTIGGSLLMIAAAALFFAGRKKAVN